MTIATEIQDITEYAIDDINKAVVKGTNSCALYNIDHDEIIIAAAIWWLERKVEERQAYIDPSQIVRPISELHKLIQSLIPADDSISTILVTSHASPSSKGLDPYNPDYEVT